MRRSLRVLLVSLPVLLGGALLVARVSMAARLRAEAEQLRFPAAHVDAVLADIAALRTTFPLGECRITHDASPVLDPLLGRDDGVSSGAAPPWWAAKDVAAAFLRGNGPLGAHLDDGPRGDLSITRTLLQYDGWEPGATAPWAVAIAAGRAPGVTTFELAGPNFVSLQVLAKLRLLEGVRTGDMLPALQEVRHLAELVSCEETLIGAMVATSILGVERDGYELAVTQGVLAPEAWSPASKATLEAFKRATFGAAAIYTGLAPEGSLERLEATEGPFAGRCAALAEATQQLSLGKAFLGERWPLEIDHGGPARALDAVLAKSPCRLPVLRAYWAHPEWNAALFETAADAPSEDWMQLPYVRDVAWYNLAAIATPNFDRYE